MAAHVHELRVNHHEEKDGDEYDFTYRFSGAADYVVHLTLPAGERKVVENALKITATEIQDLVEHLSNPSAQRPVGDFSFGDLSDSLTKHCIPAAILRNVLEASTDPLLITTNDPAFPWHLVRAGNTFLGLHRPLGIRAMIPYRDNQPRRPAPPAHSRPRALLIADPTGDREYARHESDAIEQSIRATNPATEIVRLAQAQASLDNVQLYLDQHFDIIHYAGHAEFDTTSGGRRGLVLWNHQLLPINTLHKGDHSAATVFLNACWGGAQTTTFSPDSHQIILPGGRAEGFGIEFARGGARTFLAPLWPVFDGYASDFAIRLYHLLTQGVPFGEALFTVRREVAHARPLDPTWAVYVLYGHPGEQLYAAVGASAGHNVVVHPPAGSSHQAAPTARPQPEPVGARSPVERGGRREPDGNAAAGQSAGPSGGYPLLPAHVAQLLQDGLFGARAVQLAPDANAALNLAIHSCLDQHRHSIHALDLLTSAGMVALSAHAESPSVLAALGDSRVVRDMFPIAMMPGHTTTEMWSAETGIVALRAIALLLYAEERGDQQPEKFKIAASLAEALQSTADFALAAGKSDITTFDLIEALLTEPHGSLKDALTMLVLDITPVTTQLRAARRQARVSDSSVDFAAAAPPIAQHLEPARAPAVDEQRAVIGSDLIDAARHGGLRYVSGWTMRARGHDAPDPRAAMFDAFVAALSQPQHTRTPIVLYSADGSGKWALVEALAYALSITPLPPQVAALAHARLIAADSVRAHRAQSLKGSRSVPLEKFLRQPPVGAPTILALRNLPELLGERDTIVLGDWRTALADVLANPNVQLVITSSSRSGVRQLLSSLSVEPFEINVTPADADLAYELLAGQAQLLANTSGVPIPAQVTQLAAEQSSHKLNRLRLAQPGLGLRLLQGAIEARGVLVTTSGVHETHISLSVQETLPQLPNNPNVAPLSKQEILEIVKQYSL